MKSLNEEISKIKSVMGLSEHRLIKHKWNKVEDRKLKHQKCERCNCEKWWDSGHSKLIYQDRFGRTHYRAPDCVLPNTKL